MKSEKISLTEEALRALKWGHFPALRKVIEHKEIPSKYYGTARASDNIFYRFQRLQEIALLVVEYEGDIKKMAKDVGRDEIYSDLMHLQSDLNNVSCFFDSISYKVQELCSSLCMK
jgi:hypothetical protein